MATHDYDLADQTGAAFRADGNLLFQAIASLNSGSSEPATMFGNMWWMDEGTDILKQRNKANGAWINVAQKDGSGWRPYWNGAQLDVVFQAINATLTSIAAGDLTAAAIVSKTADETVNNSTTLQDDDHLLFALAANITYDVVLVLLHNSVSTTPDFKIGWSVPASCVMLWASISSNAWGSFGGTALAGEGDTKTAGSVSGNGGAIFKALVRNGANAGNIQLRWAQNTADGSDSKFLKHSHLIIRNLGAT